MCLLLDLIYLEKLHIRKMNTVNTCNHDSSLTSTDSNMIRRMESLDKGFRTLMDRSFRFVQKCGEFAATLPTEESSSEGNSQHLTSFLQPSFVDSEPHSLEVKQVLSEKREVLRRQDSYQESFRNLMERTNRFYRNCLVVAQHQL